MIQTNCSSNDKPGKNEVVVFFKPWMILKDCPNCDKKRIQVCQDPHCVRRKS